MLLGLLILGCRDTAQDVVVAESCTSNSLREDATTWRVSIACEEEFYRVEYFMGFTCSVWDGETDRMKGVEREYDIVGQRHEVQIWCDDDRRAPGIIRVTRSRGGYTTLWGAAGPY